MNRDQIARIIDPVAFEEYFLEDGRIDQEVASIFEDAVEEARAKADAIMALDGWQTIDSAPRDGTRVLASVDGVTRVVAWGKTSHVPIYGFCLADQGAEDFDICSPTAWRPLPQPPGDAG